MQVVELEKLATQLRSLKTRLQKLGGSSDEPLQEYSEYVLAAQECDFMLPSPLTVGTLSETVDRKLQNVAVLLERARIHESLPEDAQAAAEQEYTMSDEDYALNRIQNDASDHQTHAKDAGRH